MLTTRHQVKYKDINKRKVKGCPFIMLILPLQKKGSWNHYITQDKTELKIKHTNRDVSK